MLLFARHASLYIMLTCPSTLGYSVAARLIDEFLTSPSTSPKKHLILVLCTRTAMKTRFTISRLRAHLRKLVDFSSWAAKQREKAKAQGSEYKWEDMVQRVHFLGVELDLCDLRSVYALANKLVNGTVGSPDATTMDGFKLPHGSPGTSTYSEGAAQDYWALSKEPGSVGAQRAWGWGLSGLRLPRLDVIVLNAGIGGWIGLDWYTAIKDALLDPIEACTWPKFKLAKLGAVVKSQLPSIIAGSSDEATQPLLNDQEKPEEPPLGEVFCSNVFGHYILAHELMPLLSRPASSSSTAGGKIVWISTVEALDDCFNIDDIQGLKASQPYESSKRLIDLLALTLDLPSVRRISAPFFDSSNTVTATKMGSETLAKSTAKAKMYLTHPGIFASEIISDAFPFASFIIAFYRLLFLFIMWIGSPWHPNSPYKAAVSAVWLALTNTDELEDMEDHGLKKCKWGSATNTRGDERVMKTEVEGWGWDGQVEEANGERRKGRKKGAVDLTKEAREDFEVLGAKCWTQMEELRKEWEDVLGIRDDEK
jgi:3-keto steroid reductase